MFGVDYSEGYSISTLKGNNVKFACRYIGYTASSLPQTKIITYSESYDLAKAGIPVVSNWEWTSDRASIKNSFYNGSSIAAYNGGKDDAATASTLHRSIGGPPGKPIYFSVDFNTNGSDCDDYFKGLASVLGVGRVGAYGPYFAIKHLYESGLIKWCWQTYAWSGGSWYPNNNIQQYQNGASMGNMIVDYNNSITTDFGQWTLPNNAPKPVWYQYPILVPFGNSNFDRGLGASHDLTIKAPPNFPVTSLTDGVISDISSPSWGKQVGVLMPTPVNGHRWIHYLHLSATEPSLTIGKVVKEGDVIGWVGGANNQSQYAGTSNPTGSNFLNSTIMSSNVQVGVALMDGPAYGGLGWSNFPPINMSLDPTTIVQSARNSFTVQPIQTGGQFVEQAASVEWNINNLNLPMSGPMWDKWHGDFITMKFHGPPANKFQSTDWHGNQITVVNFPGWGKFESHSDGTVAFYQYTT